MADDSRTRFYRTLVRAVAGAGETAGAVRTLAADPSIGEPAVLSAACVALDDFEHSTGGKLDSSALEAMLADVYQTLGIAPRDLVTDWLQRQSDAHIDDLFLRVATSEADASEDGQPGTSALLLACGAARRASAAALSRGLEALSRVGLLRAEHLLALADNARVDALESVTIAGFGEKPWSDPCYLIWAEPGRVEAKAWLSTREPLASTFVRYAHAAVEASAEEASKRSCCVDAASVLLGRMADHDLREANAPRLLASLEGASPYLANGLGKALRLRMAAWGAVESIDIPMN